ncbi:hypothetical protein CDAR_220951 [Caerostris darwini]|uniref:Uncharacterized protein n=1 Tax=Caerostris darwini TaxID=1538125 RepID=A0AAV4MTR2_9ARAC|nr:hypothetical protein CDAR_220951 [Caerostris darwini]
MPAPSIGALPLLPSHLNRFGNQRYLNILYLAENLVRKQESLTFRDMWFLKTARGSQQPRRFYQLLILRYFAVRLRRLRTIARKMAISQNMADYQCLNQALIRLRLFLACR